MNLRKFDFVFVFLTSFFVYSITTRLISGGDEKPMALLPILILKYHTVFFDAIYTGGPGWYGVVDTGVHILSVYPVVTPVLLIPFYIVFLLFNPVLDVPMIATLGKFSATILTSFSVLFFFLAMKKLIEWKYAVITTVCFAFGTLVWSVSSQVLLGHTTSLLLLTLLLFVIFKNEECPDKKNFWVIGVLSALFFFNRPSDSFLLIPVLYYVWMNPKHRIDFIIPAILTGIPFIAYNFVLFGGFFGGYQPIITLQIEHHDAFLISGNGVLALLASPSRGLFVFCPVLLLAIPGVWYLYRQRSFFLLSFIPALILCITTYGLFRWWDGTGGYGPRYLVPCILYFGIYMGYGIRVLWNKYKVWVAVLFSAGFLIQLSGSLGYPWSVWDIGTRDAWSFSNWEIAECFFAMVNNVGNNIRLLVFPVVPDGVIYPDNIIPGVVIFVLVYTIIGIILIPLVHIIDKGDR
jgi:hypothetical protein